MIVRKMVKITVKPMQFFWRRDSNVNSEASISVLPDVIIIFCEYSFVKHCKHITGPAAKMNAYCLFKTFEWGRGSPDLVAY